MDSHSRAWLVLSAALLLAGLSPAASQSCTTTPGQERAACFCQSVTVYKYYADTANGCTGAIYCYGPGQSAYTTCASGLLFNEALQVCDWPQNVQCTATSPATPPSSSPSPPPPPASTPPAPPPPPPPAVSPSPAPALTCKSYAAPGGKCGGSKKICCPNGQCCSSAGYCGITSAHCGTGCQTAFGACAGTTPSPSPKPPSPPPPPPPPSTSPPPPPPPPSTSPPPPPPSSTSPPPPPPPFTSPPSPPPPPPPPSTSLLPVGPIVSVYYQTWSAAWAGTGANLDLARMPSYVNVISVSFAKPDCTYVKGSLNIPPASTGLQFSSSGPVVRDAIAALKAAQPNTRVMLAVGGATYSNFAALNTACIKDIVDDFGFDGVDLDYEPTNSNCQVKTTGVTCTTDAESVAVTTALRNALPQGRYLLSTASWHVGCYGEGAFKASQPASIYTGVNLAMAKSTAGQTLDLINIMAYDAGSKATTGYDWSEAYRAHRAVWPNQAIAIGVEIPPEAWGGNVITLPEANTRATYARDLAGTAPYGLMLWSIHKPGCPNAQQITSAACTAYAMPGCSTPLPLFQQSCSGSPPHPPPPPSSTSPPPPPPPTSSPPPPPPPSGGGSCSSYAAAGGACGATNGGACCSIGQCCSQYGWCGVTSGHCGTGCQFGFGACTGTAPPPPPAASPSPPANSSPPPPPPPGPSGGNGTVAEYISQAQFEAFFLHRNDPACASNGFYTYAAFLTAAAAFPGFGTSSPDPAANKRELAAFLAQISHETTGGWPTAPDGPYSWGLCWITEGGTVTPTAPYCAATPEYPCAPGKSYYGRGPMQLSWNYNYIQAGVALGFDGLNNPDLVAQDAVLAFKTAVWFWMTPQAPKPSCHDVMLGYYTPTATDTTAGRLPGFGWTTNIINGGLECGGGTPKAQELDRIGYYKRYCDIYGVPYGDNLDCATQQRYA